MIGFESNERVCTGAFGLGGARHRRALSDLYRSGQRPGPGRPRQGRHDGALNLPASNTAHGVHAQRGRAGLRRSEAAHGALLGKGHFDGCMRDPNKMTGGSGSMSSRPAFMGACTGREGGRFWRPLRGRAWRARGCGCGGQAAGTQTRNGCTSTRNSRKQWTCPGTLAINCSSAQLSGWQQSRH